MTNNNPLFSEKYLNNQFIALQFDNNEQREQKLTIIKKWQASIANGAINKSKETALQGLFFQQFFVELLGYNNQKDTGAWFLETEQATLNRQEIDGALGYFTIDEGKLNTDVRVVIELKRANVNLNKAKNRKDKFTPVQQAFNYASSIGEHCRWVIVSDFVEIRLYYHTDQNRYQGFLITELDQPHLFKQFYFLLHKSRLISKQGDSYTDKLYYERQAQEQEISKRFYKDYKTARYDFFYGLKALNPQQEPLLLLNKTQKLLDRLLFIHFCEDYNIIPAYTLKTAIKNTKADKFNRNKNKIYATLCSLFSAINEGYPEENINKFNGGLFAEDEQLKQLRIDDDLISIILKIIDYDFASDLNVNILGHIFEQSISDLEKFRARLNENNFDEKQSKRKKDGIYYTPDNITRYIVEQAIGGWLNDRRAELAQLYQDNTELLKRYWQVLTNIKVLDPACGSGAFLNQAFDFLNAEMNSVSEQLITLGINTELDNSRHILEHNLFGVDLNAESVSITKLSLWLKTANRNKELSSLDHAIKCGNSLCDDNTIAGDKAFVWEKEFADIMAQGGFDVIIGNPPYGASFAKIEKVFLLKKYTSFKENLDSYSAFIELAFNYGNNNSYCGYVIPTSWQTSNNFLNLRETIKSNKSLISAIKLPYDVFVDAYIDTGIYILKNNKQVDYESMVYEFPVRAKLSFSEIKFLKLPQKYWEQEQNLKIVLNPFYYTLTAKVNIDSIILESISNSIRGILANDRDKHVNYSSELDRYFIGDIERYKITTNYQWVLYGDNLKEKPKDFSYFCGDRILIRRIISRKFRLMAIFVNEQFVNKKDIYVLKITNSNFNIKYILSILNSSLISFLKTKGAATATKDDFSQLTLADIRNIPIKSIDFEQQQPFIDKATIMLEQNQALQKLKGEFLDFLQADLLIKKLSTKLQNYEQLNWAEFKAELTKLKINLIERSSKGNDLEVVWFKRFEDSKTQVLAIKTIIEQTDKAIDAMVYQLYGLNEDDIALIEQA